MIRLIQSPYWSGFYLLKHYGTLTALFYKADLCKHLVAEYHNITTKQKYKHAPFYYLETFSSCSQSHDYAKLSTLPGLHSSCTYFIQSNTSALSPYIPFIACDTATFKNVLFFFSFKYNMEVMKPLSSVH